MINLRIRQLVNYGLEKGLITKDDETFVINRLLQKLNITNYDEEFNYEEDTLENILNYINNYAFENNLIEGNTASYTDLFDTDIMGILIPFPHEVISKFNEMYKISPETATNWYYEFSKSTNYIRTYRVIKDLKWTYDCKYGKLDITINLSKPEKDPKAIANARKMPQSGYPKCALCRENEGFAGSLSKAARQNHRIIPIELHNEKWFLQYSPYSYYNEHCICLSSVHRPMKIDRELIAKLLDFITIFPHYFIGSNADLPIVGGSILSHDHMQGGKYTFAMEKANIIEKINFVNFEDIECGIVNWPLSVIRLDGKDKNRIIDLAEKILNCWRNYTDKEAFIFSETNGEPHNTITPIARRKNDNYELDLVLRNNITTEDCPLGYYHPHKDKFNIKKENIGLIEVMGLAVLPSRLKNEMQLVKEAILNGTDFSTDEKIKHHYEWFNQFKNNYNFNYENIDEILNFEIGRTFEKVLEDAGVFKLENNGLNNFNKFIEFVNEQ